MINATTPEERGRQAVRDAFGRARTPAFRTMEQWAEDEIVCPDGEFSGLKFRWHRQPVHRLFVRAVDSGRFNRFGLVAPQQSGKTLVGWVLPLLYTLFELKENAIAGIPTAEIWTDKWRMDLLPVIEASRYRDLVPSKGAGARGGTPNLITFLNGATLKMMSGGGGDEKRSAFTARTLCVTEADKLSEVGFNSDEAEKIKQIEGRTRAFGRRKRVFLECTASRPGATIWSEYLGGTHSKVILPCPHCDAWVTPERDHLVGWHDAGKRTGRGGTVACCVS